MLPMSPGKLPPVTGSPGKEALMASDQSAQNALIPDSYVPTSSQPVNNSSIDSGDSAAALVTPDNTQALDNSDSTRASTRSKKPIRFFGDLLRPYPSNLAYIGAKSAF